VTPTSSHLEGFSQKENIHTKIQESGKGESHGDRGKGKSIEDREEVGHICEVDI
jgi:hypothetical protein